MIVAFPTNNKQTISSHIGLAKGFLIINTDTNEEKYIPNPVLETIKEEHINLKNRPEGERGLGTGVVITDLLVKNNVEVFVADEFGEGMQRNLKKTNIRAFETDNKEIRSILNQLKEVAMLKELNTNEFGFGYKRRNRVNGGFGEGLRRRDGSCKRGFGRGRGFGAGFGKGRGLGRGRGFGAGFGKTEDVED
jgi:predicted Fe-Mo cluster-binding NifX family protein